MRKLDQYLIREMIVPFLIGTVSVVLMFQVNTYMGLAKALNLDNVPFRAILQFILYKTPEFLQMTLPVGTSLAAALAMTRITRESELTAMRAAGTRILRVIAPVASFGLLVAGLNFWDVEYVMPPATRKANAIAYEAGIMGLSKQTFKTNALIELDGMSASIGSLERTKDDKVIISDLVLYKRRQTGEIEITAAKSAEYDRGVWSCKDAYFWKIQGVELLSAHPKKDFVINEKIVVGSLFSNEAPEEMSMSELRQEIASRHKTGQPSKDVEVKLQTRFSVPVACLVFAIVSPVFAILFARTGGFVGVLISFVIVLLYYNAFIVSTQILSKIEWVPVWFAAWSPNLIFGLLGLIALRWLE